ncbi:hypothetical protein ATO6_15725 [Oceanicola sp. 22II-s10i]|uniref:hypothetical protein n=1 Tax=Oceanicola sp. 22II-s10i TaxID=1317116 RepID=UPI000B5257DB|nr:hypothetical protein [Oceanicola sp. 22II-s10i]OWU83869.1 hypothetical protein ATO6_15725 [Oceanicola sp. 22II-s10i]
MNDSEARFDALQGRIAAAIERIGTAVEAIDARAAAEPVVEPAEIEALKQALEDEKLTSAQLQERLNTLAARQEKARAELERALADQRGAMMQLDQDLQRLRISNDQLRDSNEALREANRAGVREPHLINKSMLAELEALRASRAVDRSEAEAIVAALTPLVVSSTAAGEA